MTKSKSTSVGSVAVIGAGVSGLAAAYRLGKEGADVTIFEAGVHAGGAIQSFAKDGFVWERGANTMAENDPLIGQLIQDLNIEDKRIWPANANKRYIVKDGKAVQAPSNPLSLLGNSLLSPGAKLRALAEPFLWKRKKSAPQSNAADAAGNPQEEDESIGDFMERHIGKEPVEYLLDPFLAGTSGSDPQSTAVKYAYPNLYEWEQNKGSLLVGAIASQLSKKKPQKEPRAPSKTDSIEASDNTKAEGQVVSKKKKRHRGSFSFLGGMQTLPNALADHVGRDRLKTKTPVTHLDLTAAGATRKGNWTVSFSGRVGKEESRHFDAVLVTAPLEDFKNHVKITKSSRPFSLGFLPKITYQPMTALIQGFRAGDVKRPLEGFGVLVPSKERQFKTLGTLFNSYMFPDRAPAGFVTFTTFIGGSRHPELPGRPIEELQALALADLRTLLGVEGTPKLTQHIYWERAFPQYGKGYGQVLEAINKLETELPGLYVAGNHRDGLAVGKAILSGYDVAGRILTDLKEMVPAGQDTKNSLTEL